MKALWLANYLRPRLLAWTRTQTRVKPQCITDGTGENRPYLWRWRIINSQWWHPGTYLHQMILSDEASVHTHPYASVSIVLAGHITEIYTDKPDEDYVMADPKIWNRIIRTLSPGDIVWRSSTMAHQLVIGNEGAWTLFIPFFRLKKGWGFYCPKGFRPFAQYHETRRAQLAAGKSGNLIGCGEQE